MIVFKTATASQRAAGKRSSSSTPNPKQSAAVVAIAKDAERSEEGSDLNDSHNGSPPKKPCLDSSGIYPVVNLLSNFKCKITCCSLITTAPLLPSLIIIF